MMAGATFSFIIPRLKTRGTESLAEGNPIEFEIEHGAKGRRQRTLRKSHNQVA
jgi:cold shock CspA family protein